MSIKILFILLSSITFTFSSSLIESKSIRRKLENDEYSKTKDSFNKYKNHDFSKLWLTSNRKFTLGYIGRNGQRFYIRPLWLVKKKRNIQQYLINGKTRVKNSVCDFTGELTIKEIRDLKGPFYFLDDTVPDTLTRGFIFGDYELYENPLQRNSGFFKGEFVLKWYKDSLGQIKYNDINFSYSDGAWNNWFVGSWIQYNTNKSKKCKWGDLRIPEGEVIDVGIGGFCPHDMFKSFGWDNYLKTNSRNSKEAEEARKKEQYKWWE